METKYKVIALSCPGGGKVYDSGDIVTANCFLHESVETLVIKKYLEPVVEIPSESEEEQNNTQNSEGITK